MPGGTFKGTTSRSKHGRPLYEFNAPMGETLFCIRGRVSYVFV